MVKIIMINRTTQRYLMGFHPNKYLFVFVCMNSLKTTVFLSLISKNIYWHLISLKNKEDKFWKMLFTIPLISTRDTKLQSFQYKILHRTLPCNEW